MLTKIDLFREVLAIEPNSKVFFPLAKELSAQGLLDEAVGLLQRGVSFHPDHLEAKFLLIELLTRLERKDEAEKAFSGVGEMLADYPSVWALWAEKAAFGAKDPSLALRFLAQFFRDGALSWAQVLERGLGSFAPVERVVAPEAVEAPEAPEEPGPIDMAGDEPSATASPAGEEVLPEAAPEPESAVLEAVESAPSALAGEEDVLEAGLRYPEEEEDEDDGEGPALRGADEVLSLSDILDDAEPVFSQDMAELSEPARAEEPSGPYPAGEEKPGKSAKSGPSGAKLPDMGVKTMTMAAMLASQGETRAALSIYEELLGLAASEDERTKISAKIRELSPGAPIQAVKKAPEKRSSIKAVGFLKALAGRLEARAGA